MSYLLITSAMPNVSSGSGRRTYGVVAALAHHAPVELAYVPFGWPRPAPEFAEIRDLSMTELPASRGPDRAISFLRSMAMGAPLNLARAVSPGMLRAAGQSARAVTVIADGPPVAAALLRLAQQRPIVYLAHNLESGFRQDGRRRPLERFERSVLQTFSESWMVTQADADGARRLAGNSIGVRYVPNVIDVASVAPVPHLPDGRLLFVADFRYAPNREAYRLLVDSVLPAVWRHRPLTKAAVVGLGLEGPSPDPRIEQLGFVEDLEEVYARAAVVVVPLLQGGGSPLKFIEALAHALPVVATEHASRLLEAGRSGEHYLSAANGEEMAQAILSLFADASLSAQIGAAGRRLAQHHYSVQTLAGLLAQAGP